MRSTFLKTLAALLAAAAAVLPAGSGRAQQDEQRSLSAVRERIKALEEHVAEQGVMRDGTAKMLKDLELAIAAADKKLAALREQARAEQRRGEAIAAQTAAAGAKLADERRALARQVRLTYMNGREEMFKLLLSQESPASFGRMLVYYGYFNRARSRRIHSVAGELDSLALLGQEGRRTQAKLASLEQAQSAELSELDRSRDERRALLDKINQSIESDQDQVQKLKEQARHLTELVKQLGEVMAQFPADSEEPFKSAQGKLAWPVRGKLVGDYGQPIGGGPVRRDGVLFASPKGTPVRAIYHGRVAFADWLPGQGLLIVIDHGDGYMSLYGHNEALLKEAGDWVMPGEPIAEVGETGGEPEPALYFEICHNGKPLNPHNWIAR
ncbi:MAG TPA: peptidoglycan DD-metalloendopeptidase family protein [Gammaproteobacteria bacterium]|nr:peptidoglycan DD-metalloendopeptidase family protein [Gammaproteobacteria bacterium]